MARLAQARVWLTPAGLCRAPKRVELDVADASSDRSCIPTEASAGIRTALMLAANDEKKRNAAIGRSRFAREARATSIRGFGAAGAAQVVSILSPCGGEHHHLLESTRASRGDSTVATQLGQITGESVMYDDKGGTPAPPPSCAVAASALGV